MLKLCFYVLFRNSNHISFSLLRSDGEIWKCEECSIVFQNLPDLNDHKATHNKVDRPFMCDFCPNTYPTAYKLKVSRKYLFGFVTD